MHSITIDYKHELYLSYHRPRFDGSVVSYILQIKIIDIKTDSTKRKESGAERGGGAFKPRQSMQPIERNNPRRPIR